MKKTGCGRLTVLLLAGMMALLLGACASGSSEETDAADTVTDTAISADASSDAAEADAASGDADEGEVTADGTQEDAAAGTEAETVIEADLTLGQETTSMLFENATGSAITGVAVSAVADGEASEDSEDSEDTDTEYTDIDMGESLWEDGLTAEIFVEVYDVEADEEASGDALDLIFNAGYDMLFTLEDGTVLTVHDVTFTEEISLMRVCLDEESGLGYLSWEEDSQTVTTLEAETEIYEEELAQAQAAAEEEAAAKAAEEAASSSSSSSSSGSSSSSSSSSYDSGSSSSSSSSQSEDSCIDEGDLIFR